MLTVYKASAGSGKTYTLTYEYIKLLLGYRKEDGTYALHSRGKEHHGAILAITFTNKATSEMKQRIVNELAVLAQVERVSKKKSPYLNDLLALYGCSEQELRERAHRALNELLFDYGFFNISTIDAFFQNVLRVFAREADLSGNYEVELSDDFAITNGVNDLLSSLNRREQSDEKDRARRQRLGNWLRKYMLSIISEKSSGFNMFSRTSSFYGEIVNFVGKISKDDFKVDSKRILGYLENEESIVKFEKAISDAYEKLRAKLVGKARLVVDTLQRNGLGVNDCLVTSTRGVMEKLAQGETGVEFPPTISKVLENLDDRSSRYLKKFKGTIPDGFDEIYVDAIVAISKDAARLRFYGITRSNIYKLGLLSGVLNQIKKYKQENNLILLSDTNDILKSIIREDELPFIYERIGTSLRHFLIDEFQDTSRMQWENLRPLVRESMSHGYDNLIIGDEKQCIYRFRDSDPSLLRSKVQDEYTSSEVEVKGNNISANTNWRSSSEVVRFNNTIFTAMAEVMGLKDLYGNVAQQVAKKERHGYVRFTAINRNFESESLSIMTREIERQLRSGYKMSDIAILVRSGQDGMRAIEYLLNHEAANPDFPRLKILSDGALIVGSSPAVKLIISVLRMLNVLDASPNKRVEIKRRITRLAVSFEYHINKGCTPSQSLNRSLQAEDVFDRLTTDVLMMECLSLPSIVERIISRFLSEETRDAENAYIAAFQDVVIDYCSYGTGDIRSFLKWWDVSGYKVNLSFPDSMDAIKVITIHKSKGLEFRCVHIPFAKWEMAKGSEIKWFDTAGAFDEFHEIPPAIPLPNNKNLIGTPFEQQYEVNHNAEVLDQLNVTYVAFTRAKDELIVNFEVGSDSGNSKKQDESINKVGKLIKAAIEMADVAYCNAETKKLGAGGNVGMNDIFVGLSDKFIDGKLEIGSPTQCVEDDKGGDDDHIELCTAAKYVTGDRDDMWNLSKVEGIDDFSKPRTRGIILHDILKRVKHRGDVDIAARRHAYRLGLSAEETQEIIGYLTKALADKRVERWFDGYESIVRECPMVECGEKDVRPDRIVWTSDGKVEVVDYKTGKFVPKKYDGQVKKYMRKLVEMGYENVGGYVWYLESGEIEEVKL